MFSLNLDNSGEKRSVNELSHYSVCIPNISESILTLRYREKQLFCLQVPAGASVMARIQMRLLLPRERPSPATPDPGPSQEESTCEDMRSGLKSSNQEFSSTFIRARLKRYGNLQATCDSPNYYHM